MTGSMRLLILPLCGAAPLSAADVDPPGPDSLRQDGVPEGAVTRSNRKSDKVFAGTERDVRFPVPAQNIEGMLPTLRSKPVHRLALSRTHFLTRSLRLVTAWSLPEAQPCG